MLVNRLGAEPSTTTQQATHCLLCNLLPRNAVIHLSRFGEFHKKGKEPMEYMCAVIYILFWRNETTFILENFLPFHRKTLSFYALLDLFRTFIVFIQQAQFIQSCSFSSNFIIYIFLFSFYTEIIMFSCMFIIPNVILIFPSPFIITQNDFNTNSLHRQL